MVQLAKPALAISVDAAQGFHGGVRATHEAQSILPEALRAEADARDAEAPSMPRVVLR